MNGKYAKPNAPTTSTDNKYGTLLSNLLPNSGDPGGNDKWSSAYYGQSPGNLSGSTSTGYGDIFHDSDVGALLSSSVAHSLTSNRTLPAENNLDIILQNTTEYYDWSYFGDYRICEWLWNDSVYCNLSNTTEDPPIEPAKNYWNLLLLVIPLLTVFGNILVVLSVVKERSLKTVTNYFICSLAVADIMVAVAVMPFAVILEIVGVWTFSDSICDAWVAADVLSCTASILNLTAISVDRFIAVTQPIKYSKHKNSKRIFVMLALTWVISTAIAAPIALGINYSERRTPDICEFFNSDFLIYSSMGSFYIPSLIMIFLYWKIYTVLRRRARKSLNKKQAKTVDKKTLQNVIENTATTNICQTQPTTPVPTVQPTKDQDTNGSSDTNRNRKLKTAIAEEASMTYMATASDTQNDEEDEDDCDEDGPKSPASDEAQDHVIENNRTIDFPLCNVEEDHPSCIVDGKSGYTAPSNVEVETQFGSSASTRDNYLSIPKRKFPGLKKSGSSKKKTTSPRKSVTKFNFHMRQSKKKKGSVSSRREKRATKTLAIVLGVFLFCWWPFFTVNIINAICIRYDLFGRSIICNVPRILFSFFVWLGYINSFLNPVIYTIFNPEFRKAFRKLLTDPCK